MSDLPSVSAVKTLVIRPHPYRYLIDLTIDATEYDEKERHKRPDHKRLLERLPSSVKTYLRLLGRSDAIQDLLPKLVPPRNPDLIAHLELAGGWTALRLALIPPEGTKAKGVYFDPAKITPEAVEACPTMPYIYNLKVEDIRKEVLAGLSLDSLPVDEWSKPRATRKASEYRRYADGLILSNAIVPLPENTVDPSHTMWTEMIRQMHYMGHPIMVLQNEFEITKDNDERLIHAAREEQISPGCFLRGVKKNLGLDKGRDAAWRKYEREVSGYILDSDSEDES